MTSTLVLFQLKKAQTQEMKSNVSRHIRKQNSHLNNAASVTALQNSITQMVKQPKFLWTDEWKQIMVYPYHEVIYKKMDKAIYTST